MAGESSDSGTRIAALRRQSAELEATGERPRGGDPRGELIAIHHEMLAHPRGSAPLAAREYELLYHHHMRLLGPLDWGDATWRLGFWQRARLEVRGRSDLPRVRELAVHRSALVLETLRLELVGIDLLREVAPALTAIARVELPFFSPEQLAEARAVLPNAAAEVSR